MDLGKLDRSHYSETLKLGESKIWGRVSGGRLGLGPRGLVVKGPSPGRGEARSEDQRDCQAEGLGRDCWETARGVSGRGAGAI